MMLLVRLVKLALVCVLLFQASIINSTERLLKGFPGAMHHQSSVKKQDAYQLITGAMVYKIDNEQEGYAPDESTELYGRIEQTIYDYDITESAYNLNVNMKKSVLDADFDIIYACQKQACGDVNAWRLYLSKEIEGSHQNQYYMVAKHARKNSGDWYISFYVNDIAGRPRSVIDVIHTGAVKPELVVINHDLLGERLLTKGYVEIPSIGFKFNSDILEKNYYPSLSIVGDMLKSNKDIDVVIVGHTDNVGTLEFNQNLSEKRAHKVLQHLTTMQGINPNRLSSAGVGALSPKASNMSKEGREKNRRVEIVLK